MTRRSRYRSIIYAGTAVLLVVIALGVYVKTHSSAAAPTYALSDSSKKLKLPFRLRDSAEHDAALARNGGNPYILEATTERGALVYYGAEHTRAKDAPQLKDIESRWTQFQPTIALCEGRSRNYFYGALIEPFAGLPEPALVHKLARRNGIPLLSLEPSYEDEVAALLNDFEPEQLSLYFFLRTYVSESGSSSDEPLARDLLEKRTDVDGLRGSLPSLSDVDRVWKRDFPNQDDWRVITGEPRDGYLAEISDASRRIRGEHMIRLLHELVNKGERVFAVVGSGHVIRQEWNLRSLFGMELAWDQPTQDTSPSSASNRE